MKSITEFNSDKEYYEYLRIYFAGLSMQARISNGQDDSRFSDAVNDSECLIEELKKKK